MTTTTTSSAPSALKDPRKLTNLPEILACLSSFESEEAELSSSLSTLLSTRDPIVSSIQRLQTLLPRFGELHEDATQLSEKVGVTAQTAERVGGRVRLLDEEMRRIREAAERVGQTIELKSSLAALQASIEEQDWESATRHCSRAMALPTAVIEGPFAEVAVPTAESHLPPAQTLHDARKHLLEVFLKNFEAASQSRDSAATSRFFKLFPAIGWEAEGLQAYAAFVVDLVRVQAPTSAKTSSPLYYITALTALFESIAMIVDQHQPVVEKYYGKGKMRGVTERLLEECDRIVKSLLEGWQEERGARRKLDEVLANPPTPLNATNTMTAASRTRTQVEEDVVDVREIDKTLVEMSAMSGRWNVFKKFLIESLDDEEEEEEETPPARRSTSSEAPPPTPAPEATSAPPESPLPHPVLSAASKALFDDLMAKYYIPYEVWYTRTVIDKAHRLSSPDLSASPPTTTTPDDVFYTLKIVLHRLTATGSLGTLRKTVERLVEVVEREYVGVIKKRMDEAYGARVGSAGPGAQGRLEREGRQAFTILLNDLDMSSSHTERLIKDVSSSQGISQNFLRVEQDDVKSALGAFGTVAPKMRTCIRGGIEQLFNQLLRPKLRTFIGDIYKDVSYVLDEDAYAQAEYTDVVRKRFTRGWEMVLDGYKDMFSDSNYRLFFGLVLDVLLKPWEKVVMTFKYSDLGAIRFDRDIRSIVGYLSSSSTNAAFFGDARQKFGRLQQISTVLNLDDEEDVDDFYNSSGITWKLTVEEARSVAALKV